MAKTRQASQLNSLEVVCGIDIVAQFTDGMRNMIDRQVKGDMVKTFSRALDMTFEGKTVSPGELQSQIRSSMQLKLAENFVGKEGRTISTHGRLTLRVGDPFPAALMLKKSYLPYSFGDMADRPRSPATFTGLVVLADLHVTDNKVTRIVRRGGRRAALATKPSPAPKESADAS